MHFSHRRVNSWRWPHAASISPGKRCGGSSRPLLVLDCSSFAQANVDLCVQTVSATIYTPAPDNAAGKSRTRYKLVDASRMVLVPWNGMSSWSGNVGEIIQ